jgi:hypothetical protein
MSGENRVPKACSRRLVQASGQAVPPVCVLVTGPDGLPEFQIAGPYGTSGSRPCESSRSAPGCRHWSASAQYGEVSLAGGVTPMNCAPTTTVAIPTMAAAAVPTAGRTQRRLGVERPGLTVVIVFLHMLIGLGMYLKTARRGRGCHRCQPPNRLRQATTPAFRVAAMLIAVPLPRIPLAVSARIPAAVETVTRQPKPVPCQQMTGSSAVRPHAGVPAGCDADHRKRLVVSSSRHQAGIRSPAGNRLRGSGFRARPAAPVPAEQFPCGAARTQGAAAGTHAASLWWLVNTMNTMLTRAVRCPSISATSRSSTAATRPLPRASTSSTRVQLHGVLPAGIQVTRPSKSQTRADVGALILFTMASKSFVGQR